MIFGGLIYLMGVDFERKKVLLLEEGEKENKKENKKKE